MNKLISLIIVLSLNLIGATLQQAQHRLPPVIYSLNIPKTVTSNTNNEFRWSVMGYHTTYDMKIAIFDKNGKILINKKISPYRTSKGAYRYGSIQSKEFFYKTTLNLNFSSNQDLIVRFYASPIYDSIDTSFLSCIVPGGLGYTPGDTTGRKIKIKGVVSSNNVSIANKIIEDVITQIKSDSNGWGGQCKAYLYKVFNNKASLYSINGTTPTMPLNNLSNNAISWKATNTFRIIGTYLAGSSQTTNSQNITQLLLTAKRGDFIQMYWNPNSSKNRLTPHTIMIFEDILSKTQIINWGDSNLNGDEIVRYATKYPWGSNKTFNSLVGYLSNGFCTNTCGATLYRLNSSIK